ncbi:hypothetical protein CCHR01_00416 [Colletotrichum chrysophilum]|uniref:Uncharacterized protein n=1 Tax=Colletotrichum chrysophilum TaxID=1836956 RepID=A0AAD9B138_9PEZI|nr:hypothetical protein CCHR01_00416 [Colletotrichum chrysophilum]
MMGLKQKLFCQTKHQTCDPSTCSSQNSPYRLVSQASRWARRAVPTPLARRPARPRTLPSMASLATPPPATEPAPTSPATVTARVRARRTTSSTTPMTPSSRLTTLPAAAPPARSPASPLRSRPRTTISTTTRGSPSTTTAPPTRRSLTASGLP